MTEIQTAILRAIQAATEPPNAMAIQAAGGATMAARTVYKVLARLTARGLVRKLAAVKGTHNGPPRPRYELSVKGRRVLEGIQR
jgi:DNA-binding PadR family transcriptional regulator